MNDTEIAKITGLAVSTIEQTTQQGLNCVQPFLNWKPP